MIAAALAYAARGIHVLPLEPDGKRPKTDRGVHDASTDLRTIRMWWERWPRANIGIAIGVGALSGVRAPEPPESLVTISRAQLERSYWDELVATARERGYQLGWCVYRWRERYHRFPRALWRETTRAMEATS
jgi:hypothetical protein